MHKFRTLLAISSRPTLKVCSILSTNSLPRPNILTISQGQPGPLTYNRTLAQGANTFARSIEKYGGIVIFRAFVYNLVDYSDWHADRANAASDFFQPLDGQFDSNVIIQAKYGPIDFQVREPAQPIFANVPQSNIMMELQVCQEYLGQQSHVVYLPPLWQTILQFDMRAGGEPSLVRDIITGKRFNHSLGGMAAVVNVGTNQVSHADSFPRI